VAFVTYKHSSSESFCVVLLLTNTFFYLLMLQNALLLSLSKCLEGILDFKMSAQNTTRLNLDLTDY